MRSRYFSNRLFFQSLPGLLISLMGLFLAGKWLDKSMSGHLSLKYPLLLVSSCIISFKGNVELILAMHLSTMCQSVNIHQSKYNRYIFDNSCLVFAQSIVIGLTVGLIATVKAIFLGKHDYVYVTRTITGCLVSCFASSLLIVLMLILSIKLSLMLSIDPDHIILPAVSSFGDFFSIIFCVFFMELYDRISEKGCVTSLFGIAFIFPILVYISAISKRRIPQQTILVLLVTYLLSTAAGYILDFYALKYKVLASSSPVFCGLCSSTSCIYLNKKITSLENGYEIDSTKIFYTLMILSVIVSSTYLGLAYFTLQKLPVVFYILFISFFVLHVYILLKGIDYITKKHPNLSTNIGASVIPILTSSSDLIGSTLIVLIAGIASLFKTGIL